MPHTLAPKDKGGSVRSPERQRDGSCLTSSVFGGLCGPPGRQGGPSRAGSAWQGCVLLSRSHTEAWETSPCFQAGMCPRRPHHHSSQDFPVCSGPSFCHILGRVSQPQVVADGCQGDKSRECAGSPRQKAPLGRGSRSQPERVNY